MTNYESWFMEKFREYFSSHEPLLSIIKQYRKKSYHNLKHIYKMIQFIETNYRKGNFALSSDVHYWSMIFAILYHDVVCEAGEDKNEELSVKWFLEDYKNGNIIQWLVNSDLVVKWIMATKDHNATDLYSSMIISADLSGLLYGSFTDLTEDEAGLFKEFQKYNVNEYREGRTKFLEEFWNKWKVNNNLPAYKEYIASKRYSIGVYCGTFNPFHIGHQNILDKAEQLFDKVIVARGKNLKKENNTQYNMPALKNQIISYDIIFDLIDLVKKNNTNCDIHIIRGLRNQYDIQTEDNLRKWILTYNKDIKFVYLFCDNEYEHISSSSLRELNSIGKDITGYLV